MRYSYDHREASNHEAAALHQSLHKPAEADEMLGKAYNALLSFKSGFDAMEEIPAPLMPLYKQTMKAMDEVGEARKHAYQLREMARRAIGR